MILCKNSLLEKSICNIIVIVAYPFDRIDINGTKIQYKSSRK